MGKGHELGEEAAKVVFSNFANNATELPTWCKLRAEKKADHQGRGHKTHPNANELSTWCKLRAEVGQERGRRWG